MAQVCRTLKVSEDKDKKGQMEQESLLNVKHAIFAVL